MKKPIFVIIITFFLLTLVQAQTDFGVKGGLNSSVYHYGDEHTKSDAKSISSYYLTGYIDIPITSYLYLHPEVSLHGKGSKLIKTDVVVNSGEVVQRIKWLEIPLNLLGKVAVGKKGSFFAGGGPYIGVAINGENTYLDGSTSAVIIYKDHDVRSIDYGVNFLTGVKFGFISLNASYSLGLTNITYASNKWSKNIKNRVLSIGIGVSFASLH